MRFCHKSHKDKRLFFSSLYVFSCFTDGLMDEHLQLVGVVGLVACLILGIVVIALCVVLFCQKCRHRDALRRPFERRRSESILDDDPPDYDW